MGKMSKTLVTLLRLLPRISRHLQNYVSDSIYLHDKKLKDVHFQLDLWEQRSLKAATGLFYVHCDNIYLMTVIFTIKNNRI